jgi:hypothetical protein
MLELLEQGFKLNQIGGNSGIYVATNGIRSAVFVERRDIFGDTVLERESAWYGAEITATTEAEALVSDRLARV